MDSPPGIGHPGYLHQKFGGLRSKGREHLPLQLLGLARGRMREQPGAGTGGKEEVIKGPCSLMRVTCGAFTSIRLVPAAFDPVPRFSLLDSQRKGLNWDVFPEAG